MIKVKARHIKDSKDIPDGSGKKVRARQLFVRISQIWETKTPDVEVDH